MLISSSGSEARALNSRTSRGSASSLALPPASAACKNLLLYGKWPSGSAFQVPSVRTWPVCMAFSSMILSLSPTCKRRLWTSSVANFFQGLMPMAPCLAGVLAQTGCISNANCHQYQGAHLKNHIDSHTCLVLLIDMITIDNSIIIYP